jgi:hypothetical protein
VNSAPLCRTSKTDLEPAFMCARVASETSSGEMALKLYSSLLCSYSGKFNHRCENCWGYLKLLIFVI